MDIVAITITAGGLTTLIIEGIKYVYRRITKKPDYDFPAYFYTIAIPAMNLAVVPLLALMTVEGYEMPVDWMGFARSILLTVVASLISLVGYTTGLKPLQSYRNAMIRREERNEVLADVEGDMELLNSPLFRDSVLGVLHDELKTVESLEEGESVEEPPIELG